VSSIDLASLQRRAREFLSVLRAVFLPAVESQFRLAVHIVEGAFAVYAAFVVSSLVVQVITAGFSPLISRDLALGLFGGIVTLDVGLMGYDIYIAVRIRPRDIGCVSVREKLLISRAFWAIVVTILCLLGSVISTFTSMSYVGEYTTPRSFQWPILWMFSGLVGIFYLLRIHLDLLGSLDLQDLRK
jgi:hypothetical protein